MPPTKPPYEFCTETDCCQRLLSAAQDQFERDGFRGASVDRIAAAAGVAKQTIYNHYPSKEALFEAVVRATVHRVAVTLEAGSGDLRHRLIDYGRALRDKTLSPQGLAFFRTFVGDLTRMPELGAIILREGPMATKARLAEFLAAAMDAGELRRDDPAFAAEMLNGMLVDHDRIRGVLSVEEGVAVDPAKVERIVDCFLRAFRPNQG
jgi:TetR/AcrR family transcriptional repressor of mexJK operon